MVDRLHNSQYVSIGKMALNIPEVGIRKSIPIGAYATLIRSPWPTFCR